MAAQEEELLSKLNQVARSLKDKMIILEARDKYIRLHREKQTNIGMLVLYTILINLSLQSFLI
jgi:hypothetical protein